MPKVTLFILEFSPISCQILVLSENTDLGKTMYLPRRSSLSCAVGYLEEGTGWGRLSRTGGYEGKLDLGLSRGFHTERDSPGL